MEATVIGGILGWIFRLVPEFLKLWDAKNARKHELDMQDKALAFQKLTGDQRMGEINAQGQVAWNTGVLENLKAAVEGQDRPSGVVWIDAISKLMRPVITLQWAILLYPAVIICQVAVLMNAGALLPDAVMKVFGPEEKALVSGIMNFWFMGRVLEKVK